MEPETLKIKCPHCGGTLTIKKIPNLENKIITCPLCNKKNLFVNFLQVSQQPKPVSDETQPGGMSDKTLPGDKTHLGFKYDTVGRLVQNGCKQYILHEGLNVVGREAKSSVANVQISTDDGYMSRSHASIEVLRAANGNVIHTLSNAANKNATYVNGQKVEQGDRIVLNNGDTIKMANTVLRFVVPDDCSTKL